MSDGKILYIPDYVKQQCLCPLAEKCCGAYDYRNGESNMSSSLGFYDIWFHFSLLWASGFASNLTIAFYFMYTLNSTEMQLVFVLSNICIAHAEEGI